jgi:hypothetical protein
LASQPSRDLQGGSEQVKDKIIADGLYPRRGGTANLENGLDFGIKGDMGNGDTIDRKLDAFGLGKMEEAADVVVLVEGRKKAFGFRGRELECGKRDGLAEFNG